MIERRLKELGIELPAPPSAAASYAPFVKVGQLVFISGQIPSLNGVIKYVGKVGREHLIEEAQGAAHLCALNCLSVLREACEGDLDRVVQCVRLGGFVNALEDFRDHSKVLNGASDLIISVFGEKGRHARAAVGVNGLPFGVAVEVEALFEVRS